MKEPVAGPWRHASGDDTATPARRVTVIGTGYVGTVVAACLAHIGHHVTGLEADPAKLEKLKAGKAPFYEPRLDDLLVEGLRNHRLRFITDFRQAVRWSEIIFICVGTPPGADGLPDMTAFLDVASLIAANLDGPRILVNKSTVPIGSGRWLASVIDELSVNRPWSTGDLRVVSNPEFLREGNAVDDYLNPDRVVLGSDDEEALDELSELYESILARRVPLLGGGGPPVPLVRTDLLTAEMTKYASNAFLATKISFANEISRICDMVGADVTEVTAGMGIDQRIGGMFLDAGIGWGGSCFAKDLSALIATGEDYGYRARLLTAVADVNNEQRQLVVDLLLRHLKTLRGARIALLGLAFKPGTDDLRDSPAVDVAGRLLARGCFVRAYDPVVRVVPGLPDVRSVDDPYDAARDSDAVVVATDWPEFLNLDLARLRRAARGDLLLDGRNALDDAAVRAAGFEYVGIGRPGFRHRRVRAGGSDHGGEETATRRSSLGSPGG